MNFNFRRLLLWYLLYYFLIAGALRDLLLWGETDSFDVTSSIFALTSLVIFFLYTLVPYYTLYRFYPSRRWLYCSIGFILALVLPMVLRYFLEQILTKTFFDITNYPVQYGTKEYIIDNYFFAMRFMTFGVIYYFVTYSLYKQRKETDLLVSKQSMEMALLRSQLNPHFLLNSLSNIYSLVYHKSDHALPAMDKLADILKYTLYESQEKEYESLEKEINIAQNYIELARLRVSHPIYYQLEIAPEDLKLRVPLYLLIPIVENTVKHGDLSDANAPASTIIKKEGNLLVIHSRNKIKSTLKDKKGGIGLSNLERRLQLLFGEDYTMSVNLEDSTFYLNIKIPVC